MHQDSTPNTVNCAQCGESIRRPPSRIKRYQQHFCNMECRAAYLRANPQGRHGRYKPLGTMTCVRCGSQYTERRYSKYPEYCSQKCWYQRTWTTAPCKTCGKPFPLPINIRSVRGSRLYCSDECRPKTSSSVDKRCPRCGKTFRGAKRRRYCSETCYRPPLILKCEECLQDFRCVPAYLKSREGRSSRRFCSFACYRKYTGETAPEKSVRLCLESLEIQFIQEYQVGTYSLDFFIPALGLAIEVDEPYWHDDIQGKDKRRDRALAKRGIAVTRLDATPFYGSVNDRMVKIVEDAIHQHASSHGWQLPPYPNAGKSTLPKRRGVYVQQSLEGLDPRS